MRLATHLQLPSTEMRSIVRDQQAVTEQRRVQIQAGTHKRS